MAAFSSHPDDLSSVAMIPPPAVIVVFSLGASPMTSDDGSGQQQWERVVAGLAPGGVTWNGGSRFSCLQIRLSPLAACTILGACGDLGGTVVTVDDLWGASASRIQEQLRACGSWQGRFAIAEAALARRHDARRAADPEVAFAWRQMAARRGHVRIGQLAVATGWSRKRLWHRFRSQTGLTPKRAAQLIRFDYAAHRLAAGHGASGVAADSGYTDQSHLHRDAVAFTGMTPAAVAAAPFLAVDDVAWPAARART